MTQLGTVPEIKAVKKHLAQLQESGMVLAWEVPHEDILTRLPAAIFFVTPAPDVPPERIWQELEIHKALKYRLNEEKKISSLKWRVEFNEGVAP